MLKPLEENTYRCLISFRSSDFGTLYTKLNLQPGIATVIDNFYICSTNKKKVCGKKPIFVVQVRFCNYVKCVLQVLRI